MSAMPFSTRVSIIVVIVLITLMGSCIHFSCKPDRDGDGFIDKVDKCPNKSGVAPDGCPVVHNIKNIRLFVDHSKSMDGYYRPGSKFVNNTIDLLAKIESSYTIKEVWLVGDRVEKFAGYASTFSKRMLETPPNGEKSTQMEIIFDSVVSKTDTDDIAIFISDGIMSYSNEQIQKSKDHEFNIKNVVNLRTGIYSTFSKLLRTKKYETSIYAFRSEFDGTYYNYRNGWAPPYVGCCRPYYVWMIGGKEVLQIFRLKLDNIGTFKPIKQLHFKLNEDPVTSGTCIRSMDESAGNWRPGGENSIENMGDTSAQICIAVNLSRLPAYAREKTYLDSNIKIDGSRSFRIREKKDSDLRNRGSRREIENLNKSTHLLIISVNKMYTPTGSLHITMPIKADKWYQEWSCDSDLELNSDCPDKTFAFKYLIDGVVQAYEEYDKNYIDIHFLLSQ